jgi:hypothetical protein
MKLRYSRRSPLAQQSCWRYRQGTAINVILWGSANIKMFFVGAPQTESDRRDWRARELKERLEAEFLAKLTAGSLQASGLVWPIGLNARRRTIPAARGTCSRRTSPPRRRLAAGFASLIFASRSHGLIAAAHLERPQPTNACREGMHRSRGCELSFGAGCSGGAQPQHDWQNKHYCSAARKKVWRPGDQQPVQRGLAIG